MSKSEAQTRSELIDQQLAQSGWNVKDPTQVIEEFDILTALPQGVAEPRTPYEGHQFSDYVLLGKDRKPLAVVEAKKSSNDAAIGREQAKQYCYNIQNQLGAKLPFCFYTNGLETHFWDLGNYPPRKVVGFPTRDDLERFAFIRRNRKPLPKSSSTPLSPGVTTRFALFVQYWKASNNRNAIFCWLWPPALAKPVPVLPWRMH
jgi:type I restriction enzyme R subunit